MILSKIYLYASLVFLIDQISKIVVLQILKLDVFLKITVIAGYLNLHMAWNEGINFGFFSSGNPLVKWILVMVAILICIGISFWARMETRFINQILVALIIGGALGNVVDRLLYGAVADFINVTCCGIRNPYSFNIADIAIFMGAIGLIIFGDEKKA